ncbi:MAG: 6-hydroxymethylpterin diphosphokinase MptE-like protein, partial [Phycisphaerales bacterium JB041]
AQQRDVGLADRFVTAEAGVAVVLGLGLGHHVGLLAEKLGRTGVVVVFEPDVSLLRAVFERVDLSAAMDGSNVAILTRPDSGVISESLLGAEVAVSLGVKVLEHGPSGPRLGERAAQFREAFTTTVRAIRTNVVTTLMQTEASLRNGLMNLDFYASVPGIAGLSACAQGRPAVVVSAGPSLARNMHLLAEPGVRDRVVIIAVQTVLKQLLGAGIRPHFVTALDHHEISRRFYEGLSAEDVEGVTLIVEPKANPAILEAYPGAICCLHDETLTKVLGSGFAHDGCDIAPGATVAHLAHTFARHVGCDPVILVGQDLGFTDGQYYASGAAIHDVWAGELNEFNSLESMEWQRIVRNRAHLREATDHLGRRVYSDEQMSAYLVQFERMFEADALAGRTTIDATEGGVAKRATGVMTLAEALAAHAAARFPDETIPDSVRNDDLRALTRPRVAERIERLAQDVLRVERLSRDASELLHKMRAAHGDHTRVNVLIGKVQAIGEKVRAIQPAYELVQHLNQTGQLKRYRSDRQIHLDDSGSALEKQLQQIERDIVNVEWIAEAAAQLRKMLDDAGRAMRGSAPKLTRDPEQHGTAQPAAADRSGARRHVAAVIAVDADAGALGTRRDLAAPIAGGRNALQLTIARLARSEGLDRIVLLTQDPDRTRAMVGDESALLAGARGRVAVQIEPTAGHPLGARRHGVGSARAFAAGCWRGGLCGMTVWDEAFDPVTTHDTMTRLGIDAAVIVGADWALVDPGLTGEVIDRYREDPERRRLTFTQAAPGLSPCVLDRSLVGELATSADRAGGFASIGGLLGYVPMAPILDPVAKPGCVRVGPEVRDIGVRAIADSAWRASVIGRALGRGCTFDDAVGVSAAALGPVLRAAATDLASRGPSHLSLELCSGRRTGGQLARLLAGTKRGIERQPMATADAIRLIEELAEARPDAALTLGGAGDPLMHGSWREVVGAAKDAGLAVHVRTDLQCDRETAVSLLESGAGIVSIDLLADTAEGYRTMAGMSSFANARENLVAMLEARSGRDGGRMPSVWLVPRITRCDRVYEEIEPFYDRWLSMAQACTIDPLPRRIDGDRIERLPEPVLAAWRRSIAELCVLSDGDALVRTRRWSGKSASNACADGLVA